MEDQVYQDPADAYKGRAEGMLVKALIKGRADREKNAKLFKVKRIDPSEESKPLPPPPTKYTAGEQERQDVKNLADVPAYDEERQFPGLVRQKIDRKERHMKRCDAFTAYVDELASGIEQDVLEASRSMRDGLEQIDEELQKNYDLLKDESYLIPKSEDDLKDWLAELNRIVANRMAVITGLGDDLEKFEVFRAESIEKECRKLTKELISIAHQLPDEIEHIIEGHTYDLNNVLVSNRTSHVDLLALLKKKQVTVDIMTTQYWEDGRVFWRGLRHSKALDDFNEDIRSDRFEKPNDRVLLMQSFKTDQEERYAMREEQLRALNNMNTDSIMSEDVKKMQEISNNVAEMEEKAIQECYDDLGVLRHDLEKEAQRRVEELRLELHVYGSLHTEPFFKEVAQVMHEALEDEELSELWRLGGGLKPDFTSLKRDVCSENIAYGPFLKDISGKLKLICCGFGLKAVLEERGRMMQLEKVRSLGMKMRTVPRAEVDGVLEALLPDLDEICTYEQLKLEFVDSVSALVAEIRAEQERVAEARLQPDPVQTMAKTGSSSRGTSRGGSAKSVVDTSKFVDSNLVKAWNKRIGVLFYGSDLPAHVQEGCNKGLLFVTEQETCNEKIDKVVLQESKTVLDVMDKKYKRLIDDIAAFLEAQANYMQVCLTNTGNFFLDIAKAVELHRAEQKRLDDKSEDLLYDLKEDFRIEREDREVEFEQACQVMREATSVENLQQDFELVLKVLDDISDSYRTYHGNACFGADKYPLSLADEFKTHLNSVAGKFSMSPQVTHRILSKYNFIFDETVRLNQKYFLDDPNAGGVTPREKDLQEFAAVKSAEQSLEGSVAGGGLDEEGNPIPGDEFNENAEGSVKANEEGSVEAKEEDVSIAEVSAVEETIVYDSPLVACGGGESLYGSFNVQTAMDTFVMSLTVDKDDEPAPTPPTSTESAGGGGGEVAPAATTTTAAPISHPHCKFVRLGSSLPITKEAQEELDEYDLYDYEKALARAFIPLSDEDRETLSEEEQAIFDHCTEIVPGIKERIAQEEDPSHLRTNVPVDPEGKPWALKMEIPISSLSKLVIDIRDSLVTSAEKEAAGRLERADAIRKQNKEKFTNELEDRLRTHWPRRGRVETGIKQPREAELLGHAEKTYRYIQGIHDRMIEVQREVVMTINQADDRIEGYKKEIGKLAEHVSTGTFRNLAMLQGIEVKARGVHLSFQSDGVKRVDKLLRIINAEVDAIVAYAMDFRKVCPPQVPGVEGGYSEAEILEIEEMVKGQCEEANSVQEEWKVERQELIDRQKESLAVHTTFTETFEKVAQNVAMSEGLGQKYGAPRRRAQERIRSEVARDERNAGKIDEMLAKVEFICDEVKLQSALVDMEAEEANTAKDDGVANNGFKEIERSSEAWKLLLNIRAAAQARVEYLETISIALETPTLDFPETKIEKITDVEADDTLDMGDDEGDEMATAKKSTIREVMEEMDEACRAETRTLYESEGMADMLGEGGVPDSLQQWLASSKEKILGPSGHREKAWKRLWAQMERFEKILGRKPAGDGEEEEGDEGTVGQGVVTAPGVCMRMITAATSQNILYYFNQEQVKFKKVMSVLQEARDKHERLLRPRLGSPDAAAELQELDDKEHERSAEYTDDIVKFRSQLIQDLVVTCGKFCEDVGVSSKSLVKYIDTSMRLEAIELPPSTAVPKKRMTLKRLRKAKRIQDAIARGEEDRSIERDWPALDLSGIARLVESVEDLVPELADEANVQKTLLTAEWVEATQSNSIVHGAVSTAHRILINERDTAIQNFCEQLADSFFEIRETYGTLVEHEKSWLERWEMQVGMLRSGDL